MKCGHSIHQSCFCQLTKTSYKCPICSKSVVNMEAQFRLLDAEIEANILPEPYSKWRCVIVCNDCSARSNVNFHFLGLKCSTCKSYNTAQLSLIKPEEDDDVHARTEFDMDRVELSVDEYTVNESDSEDNIM